MDVSKYKEAPTIMIVDDSVFMRNMLHTMLDVSGYNIVAEANDGSDAVLKSKELSPEIIFMDVLMPIKNGIDATKEILAFDKNVKIVMCSSLGHEDLIKVALETGARDVVLKPYKNDQLQEVLHRIKQY